MPQSLSSILIHLVFSTKNRQPMINQAIEGDLHAYMSATLRNLKCPAIIIGGDADHIHALFCLSRVSSLAEVVKEVKISTSKWIKGKGPEYGHFQWQVGYGAFSIGQSGVEGVKRYIENQKEHHRRSTFEDEYRAICVKYGVTIDERYVWD